MIAKLYPLKPSLLAPIVILFAGCLASCTFSPTAGPYILTCDQIETIPSIHLSSEFHQPVITDPGTFIAIHGGGNAILNHGAGGDAKLGGVRILRFAQSVPLPPYVNRATVFLNGWRLGYSGNDHHVFGLGSLIGKIRLIPPNGAQPTLTWDVWGLLLDNAGQEGYSLEYTFTVIGWNDANLNAVVDHGVLDPNNQRYFCSPDGKTVSDNFISVHNAGDGSDTLPETTTALLSFFSFIQNNAFAGSKAVAVLPRGFGFAFFPVWDFFGLTGDHHLLQIGYNLDHSEIFADANKKYSKQYVEQMNAPVPQHGISHVDSGLVSWNTYAILKDNDTRRNYAFVELVSAMGGNDVGVIQPPFSFLPSESDPNCGSVGSPSVRTEQVVIENIPFRYAIPMLTGWDLEYLCTDHHVKEVGVWIDGWSYNPSGTLSYTLSSVLRDNSNNPGALFSHRVTILGFRPVAFK